MVTASPDRKACERESPRPRAWLRRRRGAALLLALFVMATCSMIVISTLDTQTLQYSALRNTMQYDRARYLAEAALQHSLAFLEQDYAETDPDRYDIPWTNFPNSDNQYSADVSAGANGTLVITGQGRSGQFTRKLTIVIKMGG